MLSVARMRAYLRGDGGGGVCARGLGVGGGGQVAVAGGGNATGRAECRAPRPAEHPQCTSARRRAPAQRVRRVVRRLPLGAAAGNDGARLVSKHVVPQPVCGAGRVGAVRGRARQVRLGFGARGWQQADAPQPAAAPCGWLGTGKEHPARHAHQLLASARGACTPSPPPHPAAPRGPQSIRPYPQSAPPPPPAPVPLMTMSPGRSASSKRIALPGWSDAPPSAAPSW